MHKKILTLFLGTLLYAGAGAQLYPQNYFRHPLNIPLELVANFGEIRTNHWHMGLDIRTQQRVNLPVYASAAGYVSRVLVEPGGFGQAIYITHPNGFTTLYAHLNGFFPALDKYVKEQQYALESWKVNLVLPPDLFPVNKSEYIGLSGSTGGSAGPHVHFEIRDSKTEKVLNPLLFNFPIADAVPPSVVRLALYNRNLSTYRQPPQLLNLQRTRNQTITVGSDKISFAVGSTDRFSGSANPNGIYAAKVLVDGQPVSGFTLDNIGYDETRYINAQIDYPYTTRGGGMLQHLSPLPGALAVAYNSYGGDGIIHLADGALHDVLIEVSDAKGNVSRIPFRVQYNPALAPTPLPKPEELFYPNEVNVFEEDDFQLVTTDKTMYDTVPVSHAARADALPAAVSLQHSFLSNAFPAHDSVVVRIKPTKNLSPSDRVVIVNRSGSKTFVQKAVWQNGWLMARFRQFGTYTAYTDLVAPVVNNVPTDLSRASRIVFTPTDNLQSIKSFRAELDGQWLRFTNDKGRSWIYAFDERFSRGEHQLKVVVEDEAGNMTERVWNVRR